MFTTKTYIEDLIKKASQATESHDALAFAQAASNCAQAFAVMANQGQHLA